MINVTTYSSTLPYACKLMPNAGTGKTTLCKALAQKVFIRNSNRFTSGGLLEINSHALFSKWFSESGTLVLLQLKVYSPM